VDPLTRRPRPGPDVRRCRRNHRLGRSWSSGPRRRVGGCPAYSADAGIAGGMLTRAVAGGLALAAAAHAAPAALFLSPVRDALTPRLAGHGDPGHVALTFDDGPHPEATPAVLAVLRRYQVRATFFVLGGELALAPARTGRRRRRSRNCRARLDTPMPARAGTAHGLRRPGPHRRGRRATNRDPAAPDSCALRRLHRDGAAGGVAAPALR